MHLREVVETYKKMAGQFGRPVSLASFGLERDQAERLFSALDEDYHISRYFHFSDQRPAASDPAYQINGFPHTHVAIDREVEEVL